MNALFNNFASYAVMLRDTPTINRLPSHFCLALCISNATANELQSTYCILIYIHIYIESKAEKLKRRREKTLTQNPRK